MNKVDESRKTGLSRFWFWTIRFQQFQDKTKEGPKFKDLKIQSVLRHEKGLKSITKPRWKKSKPKVEATKNGVPGFPKIDRVRLGFEI
jgi:hypothetical protein